MLSYPYYRLAGRNIKRKIGFFEKNIYPAAAGDPPGPMRLSPRKMIYDNPQIKNPEIGPFGDSFIR